MIAEKLNFKNLAAVATVAMMGMTPISASANTVGPVTITGISAEWIDVLPASGITKSADGLTLSWGTPSFDAQLNPNSKQSSYVFDVASTPFGAVQDVDFALGTFTHNNFPITGTTLDEAILKVTATLNVDGTIINDFISSFRFEHTETTNNATPCAEGGSNPCPDRVRASIVTDASSSVTVDNVQYFIDVTGFETDTGAFTSFLTQEGQANSATLLGQFTAEVGQGPDNVVPLPAAAWLLLGGLGSLGVARRFRKG